jgi:hypothetical protein
MATDAKTDSSDAKEESVTNNQHAGVDEGGIVKLHGEHLVILRRGRLFTVSVGDDALRPISSINAFGPDINPEGTWYDEMLISGDTIAVVGYSYQRGGTEIGLFNVDQAGTLRYRSTYHLRSNDYFSSRNYASRLIGNKLIFYTPLYLELDSGNPTSDFPALRKWKKGATEKDFEAISSPARTYRPVHEIKEIYNLALHTVSVCNLDEEDFQCQATSVVGPAGRVFYVSPKSVYVWTTDRIEKNGKNRNRSVLYQMPLDGSAPTAIGVAGSPVDQFSFLESEDDALNVLVRSEANGDGMWNAEVSEGDVALLRVPREDFANGRGNAKNSLYRPLPKAEGYSFQNRFIGSHLLYGTGNSWDMENEKTQPFLYAVNWKSGAFAKLPIEHSIDRIESLGKNALIVGTIKDDLYFSPVELSDKPQLKDSFIRKNAVQGEERSHGFFYKTIDSNKGLLGLPILESEGDESIDNGKESASILFFRNDSLKLNELGTLAARPIKQANDGCQVSCIDWYGNARPLFLKGRVFALMGYEIVEGTLTTNGIKEKRRSSFSPAE